MPIDVQKLTREELQFLLFASEIYEDRLDDGGYPLAKTGKRITRTLKREGRRRKLCVEKH
jgi:hypothetical protein